MAGETWLDQLNAWVQQQLYGAGASGDPTFAADPRYAAARQMWLSGYRPPDANVNAAGGLPAWVQTQQNNRRYGGSPLPAPAPATYEDFVKRAQAAQLGNSRFGAQMTPVPGTRYTPAELPGPAAPAPEPTPWWQQPLWQYTPGGANPLANVPNDPDQRAAYLDSLDMAYQWARMGNDQQVAAQQLGENQRQFDAGQQNWLAQFGAGRQDQAFQNWLAQQQLDMQRTQAGADNGWRNRQLDLQAALQNFQTGPQWQSQEQQRGIDNAYRQAQMDQAGNQWSQEYQRAINNDFNQNQQWLQQFQEAQRLANQQQSNWTQQFGADRADAAWNQGFQQRQADQSQNNWQTQWTANREDTAWQKQQSEAEAARQRALDQWNQAFSQAQFDYTKQRAGEQDALQRETTAMGTFNRRFGPNIAAM